jgi:hypothetical protein
MKNFYPHEITARLLPLIDYIKPALLALLGWAGLSLFIVLFG